MSKSQFEEQHEHPEPNTGFCIKRDDQMHCVHWWEDEGPCCTCGFDGDLDDD